MVNKEETNIGKYAFKLGSISIYTENNIVFIEVEDKLIQLDSETYLPISQSLIGKKNNMSIVDNRVVYYNVELNCVTDEEINMDR